MENSVLCACGCGLPRPPSGLLRFKKGHRNNATLWAPKPCHCGCGQLVVQKPKSRNVPARYLPGHHRIGRRFPRVLPRSDQIPSGICECGCDRATAIATYTDTRSGTFRGFPRRFISRHSWGGKPRRELSQGYVLIPAPHWHPFKRSKGRIYEHRLVMESMLGRLMRPEETVHHLNGDRADNRPENLEVWSKSQPPGQRVQDKVAWAKELLALYEPSALAQADHLRANATL